ncbi:hypothetical protein Y032_0027g1550 [Ancylostoma ceylanicum]|uniref:Uncharacterized protein n=1 Tax=Ancylostoma ceylanicum TaxID=53326 RepID=A0A016UUL6_9BILA|nr:hypothetical protein Y032_0027g1550 [Ancylostoma ceylanicum]
MMVNVSGHPIGYVILRDAGRECWFASLVSPGYALMNPSPGGRGQEEGFWLVLFWDRVMKFVLLARVPHQ